MTFRRMTVRFTSIHLDILTSSLV